MPDIRRNLLIVLALCSGIVASVAYVTRPRPVTPRFPPALVLSPKAVAIQMQKDRELAQKWTQIPQARALDALFAETGRAERSGLEDSTRIRERRRRITELVQSIEAEGGPHAMDIMRAAAAERMGKILASASMSEASDGYLGTFPNLLIYHRAAWDGRATAPAFVVRTLYKARWNTIQGLDHTTGLSHIEAQAYFGWLALHADRLPPSARLAALPHYATAGGARTAEAAGVLLYKAGQFQQAAAAFRDALSETPSIRVRNYLLASEAAYAAIE